LDVGHTLYEQNVLEMYELGFAGYGMSFDRVGVVLIITVWVWVKWSK